MMRMTHNTVDVDAPALDAACRKLGVKDTSERANTSLRVGVRRRMLRGFDVRRDIDGDLEQVREGREQL
jgi:hypothetical protein